MPSVAQSNIASHRNIGEDNNELCKTKLRSERGRGLMEYTLVVVVVALVFRSSMKALT